MSASYGAIFGGTISRHPNRFGLAALCVLALCATAVRAVQEVEMHIDAIDGADWKAEGVVARLDLGPRAQGGYVEIERLQLARLPEPLRHVRIRCPDVELSTEAFGCADASVALHLGELGQQELRAALTYGRRDASLRIEVRGLKIGDGSAAFKAQLLDSGWKVEAALRGASADTLLALLPAADIAVPLASASGAVTVELRAEGSGERVDSMHATGSLVGLTANNESGSLATDALELHFVSALRRDRAQWRYEIEVNAPGGQAYVEPIFLDFTAHGLKAGSSGTFGEAGAIAAERFAIEHMDVLEGSGSALIDLEQSQPVRELTLNVAELRFPGAYESYLQPLLLDTNFQSLRTSGTVAADVVVSGGEPQRVELHIEDVDFDGGEDNFAVRSLSGQWHWRDSSADVAEDAEAPTDQRASRLQWTGGAVYGLQFGASVLEFATEARNFRLLEPSRIPLLDGAIQLDSFRVRNLGAPNVAFMIDAVLQPVSVQRLCQAFGWPEFGGQLGGAISKLRMRDGVVTLGTTLRAQVFDGDVTVTDLRLEEPFGQWPRFYSNVGLHNLDLELVTGAFSFGRITGRLSGSIDGLELFNWSPVAFDARLYTPKDDRSRHRISQRAVQNIGSIGGGGAGVTAALSSGLLRFFEDFNYARLGISCRLQNEVCEMSGVGPAPNGGYYLVQGRGVPRIDVIGNSRRVDWPRLVQQLIAATESGGAVVE